MDKQDFLNKLSQSEDFKLPAKTVVLLYRDAICEALHLGYTKKAIYDVLVSEGIYSSGYSAFTQALKRHIKPVYSGEKSLPMEESQNLPTPSKPLKTYKEPTKPKKFSRAGNDIDKLIGG